MDKVAALKEEIKTLDGMITEVGGQLEQVEENLARLRIVRETLQDGLPADQLELDLSN